MPRSSGLGCCTASVIGRASGQSPTPGNPSFASFAGLPPCYPPPGWMPTRAASRRHSSAWRWRSRCFCVPGGRGSGPRSALLNFSLLAYQIGDSSTASSERFQPAAPPHARVAGFIRGRARASSLNFKGICRPRVGLRRFATRGPATVRPPSRRWRDAPARVAARARVPPAHGRVSLLYARMRRAPRAPSGRASSTSGGRRALSRPDLRRAPDPARRMARPASPTWR